MANYKINRNKPEPTEEQINKHKDFQQLINNHQQITQYKKATKPLYKNPGFLSFIVLMSVVLLTFIITENESSVKSKTENANKPVKSDSVTTTTNTDEPSALVAPVQNENSATASKQPLQNKIKEFSPIKHQDYKQTIAISEGGIVYFGSTRVLIPPFAFADANGNQVKENVEIRYKEYRDPVGIAFASIPMHYDSAQKQLQLISAGMFDIRGYVNDKPVVLSKPIQVEISSTSSRKDYNLYRLNEQTNQWEYISRENKSYRFIVTGNEQYYPELFPFKAIEWEFKPTDSKQLADFNLLFSKEWSQFILEEEIKPETATSVKFKRLASEHTLKVSPVKITTNPELNRQLIQAKYTLYKERLKKKQRNEQLYQEAMQKRTAWLNSFEGKKYIEWMQSPEGQQQRLAMRVVSVFTVNSFGIWNCDTPINLPQEAKVNATFKDSKGITLDLKEVRLVDYSKNTVYTYYKGKPVQFNPKAENILWASMPGGKLAVFTKENFKTIPSSGNAVFVMNVIDINGKTEEEVKELLAMKNHSTSKDIEKEKNATANYERMIVLKPVVDKKEVFYTGEETDINSNGIKRAQGSIDVQKIEAEENIRAEQERIKKETEQQSKQATEDAQKKAEDELKKKLPFGQNQK